MNLIDRYVYSVAEYLPGDIANDVTRELRSNIEDMLPENHTEEDVYRVLEELGNPLELAKEYHPGKRYLIGPGFYDSYIPVLKAIAGICCAVFAAIALTGAIVTPSGLDLVDRIAKAITNVITEAFNGAVQGMFWVTLAFVILERSGLEGGLIYLRGRKWTPDALPEVPLNKHNRISRAAIFFSMFCTILFTALLYLKPELIALYFRDENGTLRITTLFDTNKLKGYMVFVIVLAAYKLGSIVWMYISKRWNRQIVICSAIYNALAVILAITMLSDKELYNAGFVPALAEYAKGSVDAVAVWFDRGRLIIAVLFIIFAVWDSLAGYFKYRAGSKEIHEG